MLICSRCGTQNPPNQQVCSACGSDLGDAAKASSEMSAAATQTLFGHGSPAAYGETSPASARTPGRGQTQPEAQPLNLPLPGTSSPQSHLAAHPGQQTLSEFTPGGAISSAQLEEAPAETLAGVAPQASQRSPVAKQHPVVVRASQLPQIPQPDPPPAKNPLAQTALLGPETTASPGAPSHPAPEPTPVPQHQPAAQPQQPTKLQQTMLGIAPLSPADLAVDPQGTLPSEGVPAPQGLREAAAQALAPPASQALPSEKKTMLGVAPLAPQSQLPQSQVPASQALPSEKKTMLGVAPLQPGGPTSVAAPSAAAPASVPLASEKRTMLGVAMPGIAPLNPGVQKAPSAPPPKPESVAPDTLSDEELSLVPGAQPKSRIPVPAIVAIAAAVLLLALGVTAFLVWGGSPPVSARLQAGEHGGEVLLLQCDECPDGTRAVMETGSSEFKGGKAQLQLQSPFPIGDHEITVTLQHPGGARENIELELPVDYRVRTDVSALDESPPKIRIRVEARPGTKIVLGDQPLVLNAEGKASHDVDVSEALTGSTLELERLERSFRYTVTAPGGSSQSGELKVGLAIVPLSVEAPWKSVVVDRPKFTLAGRAQKGAAVTVSGRPLKVAADGSFAQLMNVSSVGETTIRVRATAKDHAPRLVPLRVRRVESLQAEAKTFAGRAERSYGTIAAAITAFRDKPVALTGKVEEARVQGHRTIVLLDVNEGCAKAPCLTRLVLGRKTTLAKGDLLTAYGYVTQAVDGPRSGVKVPEVRVEFFLEEKDS